MIVTCNTCPRQLCFRGARDLIARLFGWVVRGGRWHCPSCGEAE